MTSTRGPAGRRGSPSRRSAISCAGRSCSWTAAGRCCRPGRRRRCSIPTSGPTSPRTIFYGFGIMIEEYEGLDVRQHGGNITGLRHLPAVGAGAALRGGAARPTSPGRSTTPPTASSTRCSSRSRSILPICPPIPRPGNAMSATTSSPTIWGSTDRSHDLSRGRSPDGHLRRPGGAGKQRHLDSCIRPFSTPFVYDSDGDGTYRNRRHLLQHHGNPGS